MDLLVNPLGGGSHGLIKHPCELEALVRGLKCRFQSGAAGQPRPGEKFPPIRWMSPSTPRWFLTLRRMQRDESHYSFIAQPLESALRGRVLRQIAPVGEKRFFHSSPLVAQSFARKRASAGGVRAKRSQECRDQVRIVPPPPEWGEESPARQARAPADCRKR